MIVDDEIRGLVNFIEKLNADKVVQIDAAIHQLVSKLKTRCLRPEVLERYAGYSAAHVEIAPYPLDKDGYAMSFDPLVDEAGFWDCWVRYGLVVGKSVVSSSLCDEAIFRIHSLMSVLSNKRCDLNNSETWDRIPVDSSGVAILSRGFFEIYHDAILAELRQAIRVYIHHVIIWGRAELWTSFDRFGIKLPGHHESEALPLHVDQNPRVHPHFRTTQGVLALSDCPVERGTFIGVPGSKKYFMEYGTMARDDGEYVELDTTVPVADMLEKNMQPIPLRAGDLISWDSRTTHANSRNNSKDTRFVAYISAGVAKEDDLDSINARQKGFGAGVGSNVRDAFMHASKPPRYNNPKAVACLRKSERLTLLGKLLYGQEKY